MTRASSVVTLRLAIIICAIVAADSRVLTGQSPAASTATRVRDLHERAAADPFDAAMFQAYLASLPRDGDYYVLEGDMLATQAEVREYLLTRSGGETRSGIRPELVVSLRAGRREYYENRSARTLPYFVDRASFAASPQLFESARLALRRAADVWQDACPECGISFREVNAVPSGPDAALGFVVRHVDVQGAYIAAAFFPDDAPARRILRLDRTFFVSSFDPIGVLRHELGHTLGYRHEHIRGIAGCALEGTRWLPLTPYDPHSVMHYMCGGAGSLELALSATDVAGHRALYSTSVAALAPPPGQPGRPSAEAVRRLEEARADPFNVAKRAAFLATLPKVGDYFVLEGDLRMTEQEVVGYLVAAGDSDSPAQRTPELIVNLHRGSPDFYPAGRRTLSYYVDRSTFQTEAEYAAVTRAVAQATRDWEALCATCGVTFAPVTAATSAAAPNFVVRYFRANGEFIAAAFFPHDAPARRTLDIDPSFFTTTFDRVGVIRHELGHVLGYRHEHIRGVRGCFREDNAWRPLTDYDARSVMHYFCGAGGSLKLDLTSIDRDGHTKLYGLANAPPPTAGRGAPAAPAGVLVVSLEGGEVVDNAARVLEVLNGMKLLPVAAHTIAPGDVIDSVYPERLGLPSHSQSMTTRVANTLNGRNYLTARLQPGDKVLYPAVRFTEDTYGIRDDRRRIEQIESRQDHLVVEQKAQQGPPPAGQRSSERIELKRFELRLPIADARALAAARDRINALPTKNVVATAEQATSGPARVFGAAAAPSPQDTSRSNVIEWWKNRDALKRGDQGAVLSLLGPTTLQGTRTCVPFASCPDVILVDKRVSVHPDLKDAVLGEDLDLADEATSLVSDERQTADPADWQEGFHGTHLAGIIAARDNDFGLVGVDPESRVFAWNWDVLKTQRAKVATDVSGRQAQGIGSLQIYVFATDWPALGNANRDTRISQDQLASRLVHEKPLVVAAAGQATPGVEPLEIGYATAAPANLGDQENVLVVTACTICRGPNAQILPHANYSREFVHVAAPGENVLSTAPGGKYSSADGTSQATAFVAGLASAMAARYPNQLREAYQVKVRLQVTSMPFELVGQPAARGGLAAGIVDPVLATRNPAENWIKRNGIDWKEVTASEHVTRDGVKSFLWATDFLYLEDADGRRITVPLEEVWRLVRMGDRWVAYTGTRKGPVHKLGPGRLRDGEGSKVLFRLDGEAITPGAIEDLVLRFPTWAR